MKIKKIAQIQTKMEHYISVYWNYCKHLYNAVWNCNYRLLLDICMIAERSLVKNKWRGLVFIFGQWFMTISYIVAAYYSYPVILEFCEWYKFFSMYLKLCTWRLWHGSSRGWMCKLPFISPQWLGYTVVFLRIFQCEAVIRHWSLIAFII